MNKIEDLKYVCTNLGNLSGIQVRLYKRNKEIYYYSLIKLVKDPFELSKEAAFKLKDEIAYYQSPYYYYYAIANIDDIKLVVGPTRQLPISKQELKFIDFSLGIPVLTSDKFITQMESSVNPPLISLLQIMCMVYFSFTNKKEIFKKCHLSLITLAYLVKVILPKYSKKNRYHTIRVSADE